MDTIVGVKTLEKNYYISVIVYNERLWSVKRLTYYIITHIIIIFMKNK